MRALVESLFASIEHCDLYLGVIETVKYYPGVPRRCLEAFHVHGGSGMDEVTGMLALWRTARVLKIAPINNEMVLNYIAQHAIGLPRSY